ncbi:hypothetical protein CPAV1605_1375 [seawater metagenome]|uniref:Uncharacterized protein n=1 Tax=seawater metagenome TaxID=1561972 RepID=A0A5E8CJM8_9ZZZZ
MINTNTIEEIKKRFNKICTLLHVVGTNVNKTRLITSEIYNEVKELKNEKYCNIVHKDDLNFQLSSYYNTYVYHRKLLNIKKNKIFNDLVIFHNLLVYIINYSNHNFKSKKKIYEEPKEIDIKLDPNHDYKISSMEILINTISENYNVLNRNITIMKELCNELNPNRLLLISNIHTTFKTNINSIEERAIQCANKLISTLNYHYSQLEFYNNNLNLEINTLVNGVESMTTDLEVDIDFDTKIEYVTDVKIKLNFKFNRIIQAKYKPSISLSGAITSNILNLIRLNDKEYYLEYIIPNGEGDVFINFINIVDIYGNSNIKIMGKSEFTITGLQDKGEIQIAFLNKSNIFGCDKKEKFVITNSDEFLEEPICMLENEQVNLLKKNGYQYEGEVKTPININEEIRSCSLDITYQDKKQAFIIYIDSVKPKLQINVIDKKEIYKKDEFIFIKITTDKTLKDGLEIEFYENDEMKLKDTLSETGIDEFAYKYQVKSEEIKLKENKIKIKIYKIIDLYLNESEFEFFI